MATCKICNRHSNPFSVVLSQLSTVSKIFVAYPVDSFKLKILTGLMKHIKVLSPILTSALLIVRSQFQ